MKKAMTLLVSFAMLTAMLAACGSGGGSAAEAPAAAANDTAAGAVETDEEDEAGGAEEAAAPAEAAGEDLLVVDGSPVSVVYISNENASAWQAIGTGYLEALVKQAGGTCQIFNPENDSQVQAQMVEDAMVLNPDVLVIKPIDAVGIVPALQRVNEAGIPIIALDTGVEGDVELLTHIQTDQYSLGSIDAEYVAGIVEETGEPAKVVTILGDITSTIAQDRQNGFNETAANYDIEILSETECKWDPNMAYDATMDAFTRFPEANTVFIQSDSMHSGVIQALGELDRLFPVGEEGHVTIVGIDADPSGVMYIQQGYTDQVTEHNAALHSDIAFKVIVDYMHGYDIPATLYFPTTAVTAANVDSPDRWGTMDVANVDSWGPMDQDKYVMQTA